MKLNPKALLELVKETWKEFNEDKVPRLGAALAYYTVFSIAPLLLIAIAIVGFIYGDEAARGQIEGQLGRLMGGEGAAAVEGMVESAGEKKGQGIFATIISFVVLLLGASGVFVQLKDALNTIWDVPDAKTEGGIKGFIKTRFLSFGLVLGVGFLLLVSLVLSTILQAMGDAASGLVPMKWVMSLINIVVSFGVITVLFAMIFKLLPDIKIAWKDVWVGAVATTLLFALGKYLIGLYLGRSSAGSPYGAAGSLVVLLIWVYYSAQIVFFGAELTQVYTRRYGSLFVTEEEKVKRAAAGEVTEEPPIEPTEPNTNARGEAKAGERGKANVTAEQVKAANPGRPASAHVPAFATKANPVAATAAKGLSYFIVAMLGLNTAKRAVGVLPGDEDLPRR